MSTVLSVVLLVLACSCRAPWWVTGGGVAAFISAVKQPSMRRAGGVALIIGVVVSALATYWLPKGLSRASGCPLSIAAILFLIGSFMYAARFVVAACLEHRVTRNGWPEGTGIVLGFAIGEFAIPGPMPWYLGATAHDAIALIQVAAVGGPTAVTMIVVLVGVGARELVLAAFGRNLRGRSGNTRRGAICVGIVLLVAGQGAWRVHSANGMAAATRVSA